jgi:hypothetical protein
VSRRFWVVFLVVLLLVVGLPALGVWGWLASRQSALNRPVAPPSPVERPAAPEVAGRTEEEVLDSPFWKHRPSRAELDAIVERLRGREGPPALAVGDNGKAWGPDDGKGETGRYVLVPRRPEAGRPAILSEIYDRITTLTKREEYKARMDKGIREQ